MKASNIEKSTSILFLASILAVATFLVPGPEAKTVLASGAVTLYWRSEKQLKIIKSNPQRRIFEAANHR